MAAGLGQTREKRRCGHPGSSGKLCSLLFSPLAEKKRKKYLGKCVPMVSIAAPMEAAPTQGTKQSREDMRALEGSQGSLGDDDELCSNHPGTSSIFEIKQTQF